MQSKRILAGMFLLVLLVLAACGGEDQPVQRLTLHAQDIKFDVTALSVPSGAPVQLTYVNQGSIDHAFKIDGLVAEQKVRPGQTVVFEFTPTRAGEYKFICAIPGHEMAGMVGTLTVTP
jgi:uncharacterized cupredoxin-like copper-binding protein